MWRTKPDLRPSIAHFLPHSPTYNATMHLIALCTADWRPPYDHKVPRYDLAIAAPHRFPRPRGLETAPRNDQAVPLRPVVEVLYSTQRWPRLG
jgi:hypothetical protein